MAMSDSTCNSLRAALRDVGAANEVIDNLNSVEETLDDGLEISDLVEVTDGGDLTDSDVIAVVNDGTTKKVTLGELKVYLGIE